MDYNSPYFEIRPKLYTVAGWPWGWYRLTELAEIVQMSPLECWKKKRFITPQGEPCFFSTASGKMERMLEDETQNQELASVALVPAGWGDAVIDSITCTAVETAGKYNLQLPNGRIMAWHDLMPDCNFDNGEENTACVFDSIMELCNFAKRWGYIVKPVAKKSKASI